jgi:hypothetical protein
MLKSTVGTHNPAVEYDHLLGELDRSVATGTDFGIHTNTHKQRQIDANRYS